MKLFVLSIVLSCCIYLSQAQYPHGTSIAATRWADSVFKSLSNEQRIAQLMVVRLSTMDGNRKVTFLDKQVDSLIDRYNIGGIVVFQGSPVMQANMLNQLQARAKTPLLMCIDAEWGLGMRIIDSVLPLPRQMMLGAVQDETIVYQYGQVVADQCKRMNIHVNYAPVIDVNNNPNNPVINDRSFGEDKYKVARFGMQYMRGMQDNGVLACAKHFPGHGDVSVDSHYDLPVINKTMAELESLELYPFRKLVDAGIGSAMVAHLYIPAIDTTANRATSLSPANINGLLRTSLHFEGLTFTDALEMQGVKKFFPDGAASVQSLIAGNDMLCLPGDVPLAIEKITEAIANNRLSWKDIELHCKKVLLAKYIYTLPHLKPIETTNLADDLNRYVPYMRKLIAENAITLVAKNNLAFFPLENESAKETACLIIGSDTANLFAKRMQNDHNATVFYLNYKTKDIAQIENIANQLKSYKKIIIGIHNFSRVPNNNFGISNEAVDLVNKLAGNNSIIFQFGNAYAAKNWCKAPNLVVCYEDDAIIQNTAIDMLQGKLSYKGTLPVTVCDNLEFGAGITNTFNLPSVNPEEAGLDAAKLNTIDSIAYDAISRKAIPGAVILAIKDGKIAYQKAFGTESFTSNKPVTLSSVFDMASVTKICATTISLMKLYDEGKLNFKKTLGDYLTWTRGSNKENITIEQMLLHQGGLSAFIPFHRETLDKSGIPKPGTFSYTKSDSFSIPVAANMFMRNTWRDTMYKRILQSPLGESGKYVYSDNDFILLGKIVEAISGMSLDSYVRKNFYDPMGLSSAGFLPMNHMLLSQIIPTEDEKQFRVQLLQGYVHDPGAAMFGGVSGHAGLFSNAYDIASIMQMLLNGGEINGHRYLQKSTVDLFTAYHSDISRRGYGFDKPEKDNATRKEPYPTLSASPLTFGHTGFTGTCTWADPDNKVLFVFLSNRVNSPTPDLFLKMNVRPKVHETIYQAIIK
ncbi:MAG: glycoside hydrolase family 3 N-terminal domain-containing protein [Ferruginibacter sp.]